MMLPTIETSFIIYSILLFFFPFASFYFLLYRVHINIIVCLLNINKDKAIPETTGTDRKHFYHLHYQECQMYLLILLNKNDIMTTPIHLQCHVTENILTISKERKKNKRKKKQKNKSHRKQRIGISPSFCSNN